MASRLYFTCQASACFLPLQCQLDASLQPPRHEPLPEHSTCSVLPVWIMFSLVNSRPDPSPRSSVTWRYRYLPVCPRARLSRTGSALGSLGAFHATSLYMNGARKDLPDAKDMQQDGKPGLCGHQIYVDRVK